MERSAREATVTMNDVSPKSPSPAFDLPDPGPPVLGSGWMRGITPRRLGVIALVYLVFLANTPELLDLPLMARIKRSIFLAANHFLAAVPGFILVVKTEIWTAGAGPVRRIVALVLAVVVGAVLFASTRWALRFGAPVGIGGPGAHWELGLGHFFRAMSVGGLLTSILVFDSRERDARRRLHHTRLARVEIERQMTEARLQLLQVQIEPHFLFNSLASVKLLYEKEPGAGRALLRHLRDYLRVAIPRARVRETRLGEEVALARSFLEIFQVRMGPRLRMGIQVPAGLESALVPPLMVGTLVENAIKHGLAPRASGGAVSITARRDGDFLDVTVKDDGVGFRAQSGPGTGLANIRARLATLFGANGTLELAADPCGGVIATMHLPYRVDMPGTGAP